MVPDYNSFITCTKPKRVISEDRMTNGFKETSVLEIWEIYAAGIPMWCVIQRRGTAVSEMDDLQNYGILVSSWVDLKELVSIWKYTFMAGTDGVIEEISTSWRELYNGIDESRENGTDYRIRFTTDSLEEVGFLKYVNGHHSGITRVHNEAMFFDSRDYALATMYSCGMQLQIVNFRETVNYLIDLHKVENLIAHLEKRVGSSWVAQSEKQYILPFIHTTDEFYDYKSL